MIANHYIAFVKFLSFFLAGCFTVALLVVFSSSCNNNTKNNIPVSIISDEDDLLSKYGIELDTLRASRKRMSERTRRIIFNNDGDDVTNMIKRQQSPTAENLVTWRMAPLAGTQVDALFYCTFLDPDRTRHPTKVGEQLMSEELQGLDPLRVMVEWCKKNNMEIFASMRMNQSMARGHSPKTPMISRFQQEHPESLIGWYDNEPPFGRWSNYDYAQPSVRNLVVSVFREVCQNYDLDGLELDFFRLPIILKTVAWGGIATEKELDMVTEMMRQIREMTEIEGLIRGKPFLVAIRVPDSFGFCRDMGIDLKRWLDEGLVDILITSDMWRLNNWEYSVSMAHKYGVKAYACLSDSRVPDPSHPAQRRTYFTHRMRAANEALRARAAEAWHAGVDGIYLFNHHFGPRQPDNLFASEIGSMETLTGLNKTYFVNYRDGRHRIRSALSNGMKYLNRRILTPDLDGVPLHLRPAIAEEFDIRIAEDYSVQKSEQPEFGLHLLTDATYPLAWLNGVVLKPEGRQGSWINYQVPDSAVKPGANRIRLLPTWGGSMLEYKIDAGYPAPRAFAPLMNDIECPQYYREKDLGGWPNGLPELPWRYHPTGSEGRRPEWLDLNNGVTPQNDGLLIASEKQPGMCVYWEWNASFKNEAYVEAQVKVLSGTNTIVFCDGDYKEVLLIFPDRIKLLNSGKSYTMSTNDKFYNYRVDIKNLIASVYIDGNLVIEGNLSNYDGTHVENKVSFGVHGDNLPGKALWKEIKAQSSAWDAGLYDAMITVYHHKN